MLVIYYGPFVLNYTFPFHLNHASEKKSCQKLRCLYLKYSRLPVLDDWYSKSFLVHDTKLHWNVPLKQGQRWCTDLSLFLFLEVVGVVMFIIM